MEGSQKQKYIPCPIEDESFDVFYIDDDEFNADTYSDCADRSKTDWFWVVDREYDFNGKLLYVPRTRTRLHTCF